MIDEYVPCEDILSQINAAKFALHKAGQVVLKGHIQHCVRYNIEHGDADKTIHHQSACRTLPKRLNTLPICTNQKQEQK